MRVGPLGPGGPDVEETPISVGPGRVVHCRPVSGIQFNGDERGLRVRLVEFEMPVMSSKQLHM